MFEMRSAAVTETFSGDAAAQRPINESQLRAGLDAVAFETLKPLVAGLLVVCSIIAATDIILRDRDTAMLLTAGTAILAVVCCGIYLGTRAGVAHQGAAHAMTAVCSVAIVLFVLFRAYAIPGPLQLTGLTVVMITSGFFVLSPRWLALVLAPALVGWELIAWIVPSHPLSGATSLMLLCGTVIAMAAHISRVRTLKRQERLRLRAELARSEAEEAMRALRESEMRTRAILETALDGVIGLDGKGIITRWNAQAESIFGWTAEEALGRSLSALILPPRDWEAHKARLTAYARGGPESVLSRRIEIDVLHRDGHEFPVEVAITPFGSGNRLSFNGFVRDITMRRRAETAMREEALLSGAMARVGYELIEALNTPELLDRLCRLTTEVLECDFSHTVLLQPRSEEYVPVCGYGDPPEHWDSLRLLRLPVLNLLEGIEALKRDTVMSFLVDSPGLGDKLQRLAVHYDITAVLFIALRRGDELIGVQTAGYRGRRASFSAAQLRLARELAHVASLALENARLVEELQSASRIKSEFVATMSHELRTPLNVVLGYNELLLDGAVGPLSEAQTELLERSNRSAQQLLELISATLDLSRLEAGRMEIDPSRVRLRDLAGEVDAEIQFMCHDKPNVAVHWNVAHGLPVLFTDRAKLKVVMKNLIGNALKFTDCGRITVTAGAIRNGVEIAVADTGIGIPKEALPTIFEPFRQVDGSSTRRYGGVGLGLYIVRRLVGMLGGTVDVASEHGHGSTFRVRLPVRTASAMSESGEDVVPSEPVAPLRASQRADLA